jgi:hypothetical protein
VVEEIEEVDFKQLDSLLKLIEEYIDLEHCREMDERYRAALSYAVVDRPPLVVQPGFGKNWKLPSPWDRFEQYPYRRSFDNPAAMMQNMLLSRVVPGLILKDDNPLAIRNDHGTIQIAGLLGGAWHFYEDNYPWVASLESKDAIRQLVEFDHEIDWNDGVIPQSTKTLEFYRDQLVKYPNCRKAIQISLPDLQGPLDTADMLWGAEIFVEILTNPQLVSALLAKIVGVMREVANYYRKYATDRLEPFANTQHSYNIPGRILIRNDSSIMVSPDTYREIVLPHDDELLKSVGGGSIHFCGKGEHLVESMLDIPYLRGLDFGDPELMDRERIYSLCSERKVTITNLKPSRQDLVSGRAAGAYPTGVVFVYNTNDINDALDVVSQYRYSEN